MQQPQLQVESLINNPTAYVQASAGVWPNDFKFRDQLSIPLTLSLRPIELDDDIRSASFPNNKINQYRCHSCKAFINKYCTIRSKCIIIIIQFNMIALFVDALTDFFSKLIHLQWKWQLPSIPACLLVLSIHLSFTQTSNQSRKNKNYCLFNRSYSIQKGD